MDNFDFQYRGGVMKQQNILSNLFKLAVGLAIGVTLILTGCGGGGGGDGSSQTPPAATLRSISISAANTYIVVGQPLSFTATGTYSDGTTRDVTTQSGTTWSSIYPSIATINLSTGVATGVAAGSAIIKASAGGIDSTPITIDSIAIPAILFAVTAVSSTNNISLNWSGGNGATSYNIYWGTSPGITAASTKISVGASTASYIHTGLTTGNTYFYRIGATNRAGETLSDEVFSFIYIGGNPSGIYTATGGMVVPRHSHTATLLPNGKVLVAGGSSSCSSVGCSGSVLSSDELYDPATGLFALTGNMGQPRGAHNATLLRNGKVLITGGGSNNTAELYDPASGLFSIAGTSGGTLQTSPADNARNALLLPSGDVLLGFNYTAPYIYETTADKFRSTHGTPGQLKSFGFTSSLLPSGEVIIVSKIGIEIYSPTTESTTFLESLTANRSDPNATVLANGKLLITGGLPVCGTGGLACNPDSELYTPVMVAGTYDPYYSYSTTLTSGLLFADRFTSTLLPNGNVLVYGSYIYNVQARTFALIADCLSGHRYSSTATLLPNGKVVVIGGYRYITGGYTELLAAAELFQ